MDVQDRDCGSLLGLATGDARGTTSNNWLLGFSRYSNEGLTCLVRSR
jgi:hypothetical protein